MADSVKPNAVKLEKAHFINCLENTTATTFFVQFNPKELKLDDKANYSTNQAEQDGSRQEFNGRDGAKLSMELIFDTTVGSSGGTNVNDAFIKPLRAFLALAPPQASTDDSGTQKCEEKPPLVEFRWGQFSFQGVIDSVNTTFLMFNSEGVPLRARVNVSMTTDRSDSTATGSNFTDQTPLLPRMVKQMSGTLFGSSNLGNIASKLGVPEQALALANDITDPLNIDASALDELTIPSSSEMASAISDSFKDIAPKSINPVSSGDGGWGF